MGNVFNYVFFVTCVCLNLICFWIIFLVLVAYCSYSATIILPLIFTNTDPYNDRTIHHRILSRNKTMDTTSGARTAYPQASPESIPGFSRIHVSLVLSFLCRLCWPFCLFGHCIVGPSQIIWFRIATLVSSNLFFTVVVVASHILPSWWCNSQRAALLECVSLGFGWLSFGWLSKKLETWYLLLHRWAHSIKQ
jgi:hypothetical protein